MEMVLFWWFILITCLTSLGTGLLRRYALLRNLLDLPGVRSSHSKPTPRGGGMAFVLVYCVSLVWLGIEGWLQWAQAIGLLGAGASVALIGFLDDHVHVPVRWRLAVHVVAVAWLLACMQWLPYLQFGGLWITLDWWAYVPVALFLVWLLNLYNFMDGIDGLAGIEAISVSLGGALCCWLAGGSSLEPAPLFLAAAVLGFLIWNFPPAKIFMGDAGSGFLGITIGGLVLMTSQVAPQLLWSWLILLGVFLVDATFTLCRRLSHGEKFHEAHRSHAYQRAARRHGGHRVVTLAVLLLNTVWLLPLACLVALRLIEGMATVLLAYAPLLWLAWHYGAGLEENEI